MFYGLEFAQRFRQETLKKRLPYDVITVTNLPQYSPDRLRRSGHRLSATSGSLQMWVHPSGKEVWMLPASNPTAPTVDPLVAQAGIYVGESAAAKNRIVGLADQLRRSVGRPEYAGLYAKFFEEFQKWQDDLNWMLEEGLPLIKEDVAAEDRSAVQTELDRLQELVKWKREEFTEIVRRLPTLEAKISAG